MIARPPRADGLEPRRLPPRDGPGHEDVLRAPPREVARELAEGAFGLALTGQDLALDHDLRRGGDVEIQRRAGSNLEGLAEEPTHHLELADLRGRIGERAHGHDGVEPEGDGAGQRLAFRLGAALVLEHAATGVEAHPHPVPPLQLEAVIALRLHARLGISRHQHARRDVPPGVTREVDGNGKRGQIDGVPRHHVPAKGRVRHHHGLHGLLDPARVLGGQLRLRHAEGKGEGAPACHHVAHDGHVVAPDLLEDENGITPPALVLEHDGHDVVLEGDGLGDADDLAGIGLTVRRHEAAEILGHAVILSGCAEKTRRRLKKVQMRGGAPLFELSGGGPGPSRDEG